MQRVFDVNNKEDMDLLWSILPDNVYKIEKNDLDHVVIYYKWQEYPEFLTEICVDLHEKTEITRPANYEDMIGCVGFFGNKGSEHILSILTDVDTDFDEPWFKDADDSLWESFIPAKKSELKFYGE